VPKAKATSLLSDVLAKAANNRPGFRTWFERLPAEARAELDVVRDAFDHRTHQKRAYALAVIAAAKERQWEIGGLQAVIAWLERRR
jgi:hypothetical protein